jgi:hypothetical protein
MEIGLRDGTQSDATHEVPIASRDEKNPLRWEQFFNPQVRVVTVAAVALLKFVTRRMHDGERTTRVNGLGDDADGNYVDIVGVGSMRVPRKLRCGDSLKEICVSPRQR